MKIGIIGGTGPQGIGIASRFALSGLNIIIGSRSNEKAQNLANELNEKFKIKLITGLSNKDLVKETEVIILTIPYDTVEKTISPLLDDIKKYTKIFVDVTVPLTFEKGKGMVPVSIREKSMSILIQKFIDPVPVVAAFKTIGAHALLDESPLKRDTFVMGKLEYRKTIIDLISKIDGLRPIDSGPIREVEAIERMVPFLINLNRRYKVKDSGLQVVF